MAATSLSKGLKGFHSIASATPSIVRRQQPLLNSSRDVLRFRTYWIGALLSVHTTRSTIQGGPPGRRCFSSKHENSKSAVLHKSARSREAKTSLGRVAVDARRSRGRPRDSLQEQGVSSKTVVAYGGAERYNIPRAAQILRDEGWSLDPYSTGLYPQVVHAHVPHQVLSSMNGSISDSNVGNVFVFPSGTVVAWAVDDSFMRQLINSTLLPAAQSPYAGSLETENLEFYEDESRGTSAVHGDTIRIGTKLVFNEDDEIRTRFDDSTVPPDHSSSVTRPNSSHRSNIALAKIAFSSGLARSVKLAVLETALDDYFDSTQQIPQLLSQGSKLPFSRSFILRKTGQLLNIRAQLNFVSELTDSMPDLFWDSRSELGLETYFDQVSQALDVRIRIRILNEKMDYASEVAEILRERLSERHGFLLEWLIIFLISVEVCFAIMQIWVEREKKNDPEGIESLLRTYLQKQLKEKEQEDG